MEILTRENIFMNSDFILLASFYFLFGISIGSFLNVCIWRIPIQRSVCTAHSKCPSCHHILSPLDLIPILSWMLLRGKCRYCGAFISPRYPIVEFLTGIWFVLCFAVIGSRPGAILYSIVLCLFGCCLIVAAWIDIDHMYVPDRIHIMILILSAAAFFLHHTETLSSCLLGAVVPSGIMLIVSLLTKGGIGGGDIKLMAVSGLLLGFPCNIFAFFLAYLLAGCYYLIPLLRGKVNGKDPIPMVPFFAAALMFSCLWGSPILTWYFNLFSI